MRWMVGVDLAGLSAGAVSFAEWIAKRTNEGVYGVHVIEHSHINPPFTRNVESQVDQALQPLRGDGCFTELGAIAASLAEDGISTAAKEKNCDALLIGRRTSDATALVRLGRVARMLLRSLPYPTVVAPPDLQAADVSGGPVLLATDLSEASNGAAEFAKRLAADLDLDVLVTHVARVPSDFRVLMPADQWSTMVERSELSGQKKMEPWLAERGLEEARNSIVHGSIALKILEVARVSSASMVVVGSRGLKAFDRLFISSVASEIAASAPVPVAVVPSDWS